MPEISLTDFVDFLIKSGTPKLTKVTQIKQRPDYNPNPYFKDESPTKHRIQAVLELMRVALDAAACDRKIAVLDVTNSRIMELTQNGPNLKPLLEGEAASFVQIWNSL
ncbi:MAG: hypothetical protein ACP5VQ_01585 [Phycisphaerae bacterium]